MNLLNGLVLSYVQNSFDFIKYLNQVAQLTKLVNDEGTTITMTFVISYFRIMLAKQRIVISKVSKEESEIIAC